jgi:hypothetical protein
VVLLDQRIRPLGDPRALIPWPLAVHRAPRSPVDRQFVFSRRSSAWQSNGLLNRWSRVQIPAPAPLADLCHFSVVAMRSRSGRVEGSGASQRALKSFDHRGGTGVHIGGLLGSGQSRRSQLAISPRWRRSCHSPSTMACRGDPAPRFRPGEARAPEPPSSSSSLLMPSH